jgi:aspartate aminotransferase-like enzyme
VSDVLRAHPDTLLLVDVVSLIAGAPIDFDASGADFALAGVQKALALPPGITVFCASERYVSRARARQRRGWYLDPITLLDGHAERNTPTTPTIPLFYALAKQLDDISAGVTLPASERGATGAEAWRARFEKHARMRARTLEWAESRGLSPLPPREFASPTISCIRADGIATPAFLTGLQQAGFQIGNGYGALKNKTFRVGHMGDHTEERLDALLAAAERVLG